MRNAAGATNSQMSIAGADHSSADLGRRVLQVRATQRLAAGAVRQVRSSRSRERSFGFQRVGARCRCYRTLLLGERELLWIIGHQSGTR